MATAAIVQDRRTARALGIISRAELTPLDDMPGLFQVRDTFTGSGTCHVASARQCDCYDAQRGNRCKHQIAVAAEEQALADYAAEWDRAARPQQPRCPMCGCPLRIASSTPAGAAGPSTRSARVMRPIATGARRPARAGRWQQTEPSPRRTSWD
jgi:hypothetical protein